MNIDPVTARYAEALFQLAAEAGRLERVAREVERLGRELASPAAAGLFDARVELAQRRARAEQLLVEADPLLANLVHLLFDKRRVEVLQGLAAAFHARMLGEQGAVEGVIESARPLSQGDVAELSVGLSPRFGKRLVLANKVVPELLVGVRVIAEGRMLDASGQGRLDALKKRMLEAALPAAS